MLALAGGVLYLFDPAHFIPFTGGLVVLGAWLVVYYQRHVREPDEQGEPNVGIVVPLLNVHAYLLGADRTGFAALDRRGDHRDVGSAAHRPRRSFTLWRGASR